MRDSGTELGYSKYRINQNRLGCYNYRCVKFACTDVL